MYWTDEPATEQQLLQLRGLGYKMARPLMRTEAARLIRDLRRHPGRVQLEPAVSPRVEELPVPAIEPRPMPSVSHGGTISEATRMQAYRLRTAAENARRALVATPHGPNVRADAAATAASRREFWLDTCREVKEMRVGSMQVFELYQGQGCRFFGPSQQQVEEILDALDSASPVWDRDHPELFYQTLELNFPDLLRRG